MPDNSLNWTKRSRVIQCCQRHHRPPEGGQAKAGSHSASNLSLTLGGGTMVKPGCRVGFCHSSHQLDECGTSPFFRWVREQYCGPNMPGQKCLGLHRHSPKKVPGDKPSPFKKGLILGGWPPETWRYGSRCTLTGCQQNQDTPNQIHVLTNMADRSVSWLLSQFLSLPTVFI